MDSEDIADRDRPTTSLVTTSMTVEVADETLVVDGTPSVTDPDSQN